MRGNDGHLRDETEGDEGLQLVLEAFVLALASWCVTLLSSLALDLPIRAAQALFAATLVGLGVGLGRRLAGADREPSEPRQLFWPVLLTGAILAIFGTLTCRPDADDEGYLGPPLRDVRSGGVFTPKPFHLPGRNGGVLVPGLIEIEAWEAMVVATADLLRLDPVRAYHNGFAALATMVWAVTYALLFMRFGLPPPRVVAALLLTAGFLYLDGNTHRTFGNMSLARIWQGKVVASAVLVPALHLLTLRLLDRPSAYRAMLVAAALLSGLCLNRSMVFLTAVLITSIAVATAITRERRALTLCGPLAVPLAMLLAIPLAVRWWPAVVPSGLERISEATRSGQGAWEISFSLVVGSNAALVRDLALLALAPLLLPRARLRAYLWCLTGAVAALSFGPPLGGFWSTWVPRVCWRLYYCLPLPLCVGFLASVGIVSGRRAATVLRTSLVLSLVTLTLMATETPTLAKANAMTFKRPWDYRFEPDARAFVADLEDRFDHRRVLAPGRIAVALTLLRPVEVDLVYRRPRRGWVLTTEFALSCRKRPDTDAVMNRLARMEIDYLVTETCGPDWDEELEAPVPWIDLRPDPRGAVAGFEIYRVSSTERLRVDGTVAAAAPSH